MVTSASNKNDSKQILKELMKSAIAGNQSSYQEFLLQTSKLLRSFISKRINQSDVEDVLQEILISIHKSRHTYDCERPIIPWLMSIANFRINDHLRKHYLEMRHKTSNIDDFIEILADVTNEQSSNELINDIFADLDSKQKKILTMMYIEGYTAKEVGRTINMNESAVKVAAHRAVKKIKQNFLR